MKAYRAMDRRFLPTAQLLPWCWTAKRAAVKETLWAVRVLTVTLSAVSTPALGKGRQATLPAMPLQTAHPQVCTR